MSIYKKTILTAAIIAATSLTAGIATVQSAQPSLNNNLMLAKAEGQGYGHHAKGSGHHKGGGHHKKHKGGQHHGSDYAHMIIFNTDTLKLTNEQLGQIVRLHLKNKQEHAQLKANMKGSMKAFHHETTRLNTSDSPLKKQGLAFSNALNAMISFHVKEREALHAVLTEKQLKQLDTIKSDEHHGHGGGGHGGGHNH